MLPFDDALKIVLDSVCKLGSEYVDISRASNRISRPGRSSQRQPILFSALYRYEILTQYGDIGLRGLLEGHSGDIFELAVTTASVLYDMDCPEDYRREPGLNEQNME